LGNLGKTSIGFTNISLSVDETELHLYLIFWLTDYQGYWDVTLYSLVEVYWRLEERTACIFRVEQ
jgi:hypothetical protein